MVTVGSDSEKLGPRSTVARILKIWIQGSTVDWILKNWILGITVGSNPENNDVGGHCRFRF